MITYTYFAQPIMDAEANSAIGGYELLLRTWQAETQEWLLPKDFEITVKMQMRLIRRVLPNLKNKNVTMNLTGKQFASADTMKQLRDFAQAIRGELGSLTIEITEMPTLETVLTTGQAYRDAGISLALDDVGSDLADADMIEKLAPHVDMLKFAWQNLREAGRDAEAKDLIRQYKQIADDANIDFTLEGLESIEDVMFAQRLGIRWLQGFYFANPTDPNA